MRVQRFHVAEIRLPLELAVHVETVKAARAEESEEMLAVGHRGVRRQAPGIVSAFVRKFLAQGPLPNNLAVGAVYGENDELVALRGRHVIVRAGRVSGYGVHGIPERDRSADIDAIAPDDRRGMPHARQRELPTNILGLAPFRWRVRIRRDASSQWSAPLRPDTVGADRVAIVSRRRRQDD